MRYGFLKFIFETIFHTFCFYYRWQISQVWLMTHTSQIRCYLHIRSSKDLKDFILEQLELTKKDYKNHRFWIKKSIMNRLRLKVKPGTWGQETSQWKSVHHFDTSPNIKCKELSKTLRKLPKYFSIKMKLTLGMLAEKSKAFKEILALITSMHHRTSSSSFILPLMTEIVYLVKTISLIQKW